MSDLRSIVRIKNMAQAAASVGPDGGTPTSSECDEMAKAYERLRVEARKVHGSAGWGTEAEFDVEVPPLMEPSASAPADPRRKHFVQVQMGLRARVLLGQLAAWAAGHQETFQLEAQMEANAKAKMAAAHTDARKPMGFGDH